MATPATFSLVDKWADHLKFNGRTPRTLEELAIARADYQHRGRLAEIKAMRPKLALLWPFVLKLAELGIKLGDREITTHTHGKELRIQPPLFSKDDALCVALVSLGFREIERKDWSRETDQVKLKQGRSLIVTIDVTKPEVLAQAEREAAVKQAQVEAKALTGGRVVDHIDGDPLNNDLANLRVINSPATQS